MTSKFKARLKNIGLVAFGAFAGVLASMQFSAVAQKNSIAPLPLEELRQFADVFGLIKSDYVEAVEDKKLITEAISGMVASLDPHSAYLDKKAFKELREGTQGKFVGLGIEVGMEDGYVKVISPIEDSPAYKAGLKPGDLISRLDETPVKGLTLEEAVKKMRGEPNTKITLTVIRKNETKALFFTITRAEIRVQSVKSKVIEDGYGWIRIAQFQEPTVADMARKLKEMAEAQPNLKGLVLDLRNDPGGVLPGAIGVSAAFLPPDVVITTTNGQLEESKSSYTATAENYASRRLAGDVLKNLPAIFKTVPIVVLVNGGSASASEIVAGALQDHKRAIIMGTQTFGKGSVQTIRALSSDTAIKLTTARYYTPNGRSIQAKGITPDLLVDETAEGSPLDNLRLREADLTKHLSNDKDAEEKKRTAADLEKEREALEKLERDRKPLELGSKDDFQLTQAINHLKGLPVQLAKAKPDDTDDKKASTDNASDKKSNAPSEAKSDKKTKPKTEDKKTEDKK